jgi:hypothetical protein
VWAALGFVTLVTVTLVTVALVTVALVTVTLVTITLVTVDGHLVAGLAWGLCCLVAVNRLRAAVRATVRAPVRLTGCLTVWLLLLAAIEPLLIIRIRAL